MAQRTHYAMQSFRRNKLGELITSRWRPCGSEEEAKVLAERSVLTGRAAGAVALAEKTSGDFDGASQPITLAKYGETPNKIELEMPF